MPYRRLPNTDTARIRALRTAISKCENTDFNDVIISMNTLYKAKSVVSKFEKLHKVNQQTLETQIRANKSFQNHIKNARLYLSHFIQVLYMSVIRNEIKSEKLSLYGLEECELLLPDISTNDMLLNWGEKIIQGEEQRVAEGGVPIYNPTIAKVKVMYSIFRDSFNTQLIHQKSSARTQQKVVAARTEVDEIILTLWNEVEEATISLSSSKRFALNKEYGIIYYYRKGEIVK